MLRIISSIGRCVRLCHAGSTKPMDTTDRSPTVDEQLRFDDVSVLDSKTVPEILRSLFVLKLSSVNYIVDNNLKLLQTGQKVLGRRAFDKLMQATVYGHLVAGSVFDDVRKVTEKLAKDGIRPIIFMPDEEDLNSDARAVDKYDTNMNTLTKSMGVANELCTNKPIAQCRISALVPISICAELTSAYPEPASQHSLVEVFADAMETNKEVQLDVLTASENEELNRGIYRLKRLSDKSLELGVVILVDAEQTYSNPAVSAFAMAMMLYANKHKALIWKTYQAYLQDTHRKLEANLDFVLSRGCCFGYKLVRGAYLELEKQWAIDNGLPNPNHPNIEATHASYHKSLDFILDKIKDQPGKINFMAATHNENTILHVTKRMKEMNVPKNNDFLVFGQTYALSDHVSVSLGRAGYVIYKSVPCGTVDVCLEYFARRAQENRMAVEGLRKDIPYLKAALYDRVKKKFSK